MNKIISFALRIFIVVGVFSTILIIWVKFGNAEPSGSLSDATVDRFSRISLVLTTIGVIVAAIALWLNFVLNKRRVQFDSLVKLVEIFHMQLREDRDNVVDLKIVDDNSLNEFLTKLKSPDVSTISKNRSLIRVLNYFALMGMMVKDKYLTPRFTRRFLRPLNSLFICSGRSRIPK